MKKIILSLIFFLPLFFLIENRTNPQVSKIIYDNNRIGDLFEISKASLVTNKVKRGNQNFPSLATDYLQDIFPQIKTIDLHLSEEDLFHPKFGIKSNPKGRGKAFEKKGFVRIYDNGDLFHQGYTGVRLHGGAHRGRSKTSKKSYRLYFRNKYGKLESSLFKNDDLKRKKYVLRVSARKPFVNEISFEFINMIGGIAPTAETVQFFLNGENRGFYHLTEFIEKELWQKKLKQDEIVFYKYKGSNSPTDNYLFENLSNLINDYDQKLSLSQMEKMIDMDNYLTHIFSIIFLGCSDWVQGALYKENSVEAKWKFISWDYDKALTVMDSHKRKLTKNALDLNGFKLISEPYKPDIRSTLFNRLLIEDPVFKDRLNQSFTKIMNKTTPELVNLIMNKYVNMVKETKPEMLRDVEEIKTYLMQRAQVVRRDLDMLLSNL